MNASDMLSRNLERIYIQKIGQRVLKRSLIIVISKETGGKCSENVQKCIKNAKYMWESVIRRQGNNVI